MRALHAASDGKSGVSFRSVAKAVGLMMLTAFALCFCANGQSTAQTEMPPTSPSSSPPVPDAARMMVKGELIKKVPPKYPKQARKQHIRGTVIMHAMITKEGSVADLQVVSGDPVFVQAALDAVKTWKYRPYRLGGQPVDVETTITVNFEPHP